MMKLVQFPKEIFYYCIETNLRSFYTELDKIKAIFKIKLPKKEPPEIIIRKLKLSYTPPLPPEGTAPEGTRHALLAPNSIYYESAP